MICHAKAFLRAERPGGTPPPLRRGGWVGAPPGNPVTTPFPCFLSTERVCAEAEQGLPCEIRPISQGREKAKKGVCGGSPLRTSPAGTGKRRLEEGHSGAVPLYGTAVPLLTNRACPLLGAIYADIAYYTIAG
jgi:hypothetical protein